MLDLELIVNDTERVRERLVSRGEDPPLDEIVALDRQRRGLIRQADDLRSHRNEVSRAIGRAGEKPSPEQVAEMRDVGNRIRTIEAELAGVQEALDRLLADLPNLPLPGVPIGRDESDNVIVHTHGEPAERDFEVEPHWDSGPRLGLIDLEAGARLSGTRWYVLRGKAAQLQRALATWMLDVHIREHGYEEIAPPLLVRRDIMMGSGNLPKFGDNLYHDEEDDLWLIPTAEVPLAGLHAGEIIPPGRLPLKYVAHTACFRREKAAAGRDTRGIKRVHQFDKVEMFRFTEPDASDAALEEMTADAADLCARLGLVHRVARLCTGEIGVASANTYDIEVWAAGSKEWLEVSSVSTCTDFQARRTRTRYRPKPGAAPRHPHTLNGSGLALPRVLIALMENNLQADGSITVPDVIQPYTGFDRIP